MDEAPGSMWDATAQAMLAALPDGVLLVDRAGDILDLNERAAELFGADVDTLRGRTVESLIPRQLRAAHVDHREGFHKQPTTRAMGAGLELKALRADGTTFPVDISLSEATIAGEAVIVASVRDMTEQRDANRALRSARDRVARLEDRERIARDLHDTVIQEVFGAGLMMQSVVGQVDDSVVRDRLEQSIERLDGSISKLRSVIFDLQSHDKDDTARSAIDGIVNSATPDLGFRPTLVVDGDVGRLDPLHLDHLLPTVREALANVSKHAFASRVDLHIVVGESDVTVTVVDDGIGIESVGGDGMGIRNMTERALELGGRFEMGPAEGRGTRLVWCAPLDPPADGVSPRRP